MARYTDTGPLATTTEILQALTALGLLERPFTRSELAEEETNAGGAEVLRLRMAHALAGAAEMQILQASIAAGEAGHAGPQLILAGDYAYEGADLDKGEDAGYAQAGLLRLVAQRLADLLTSRTAAIKRGDDIVLPRLVMPAWGIASALATVMNVATKDPEENSGGAKRLHEAAGELRGMADVLEEFAGHYANAERG
ncbi:hypothetical protein PV516_18535 [Streptomyces scabiei]|uniref:hypothetical protein n=1 Tax=Streptomyces scabiei TaxID=1930 RepID=UPI0029A1724D|nr:hypothetical protein [Streptomyces scabiei]MDX3165783.1 hypothetical protein [Streptomyces scabiei]